MKETKELEMTKKHLGKGLPILNEHAAGIDVGDTGHDVAINSVNCHEVRQFAAFTEDLQHLGVVNK